jgi:predicted helicase
MCRPFDWAGWDEYVQGWPVADALNPDGLKKQVFAVNVLGFQTHRDHFAIAFENEEIEKRVRDMRDAKISDGRIREKYEIPDNRDWKLSDAREALQKRSSAEVSKNLVECAFRPFDRRSCFFGTEFMDYPRRELVDHVLGRSNLQLLVSRQIGTASWRHSFIALEPAESCCISDGSTEQNYCFPLLLQGENSTTSENVSAAFRAFLDTRYARHYEPQEILGFIYAVLYAPTYRARYAEFLRIDFPRIPFPERAEDFEELSRLGWAVVEAHLLRTLPHRKLAAYHGKGGHEVEFVRYSETDQSIAINTTQSFRPVAQAVWDFHIGGYQVLDKYLKSRKGRKMSLDEIDHVPKVADVLAFTIDQMAKIDKACLAAFPERG